MNDAMDLRDTRGRLVRLAIATAVAAVTTFFAIHWINSVSRPANKDPVGGSTVALLAIAIFVMTTLMGTKVLARVARRRV